MEIWKSVKGYEGIYEISNKNRVKALEKIVNGGRYNCPRLIKEKILKSSYNNVQLSKAKVVKTFDVFTLKKMNFDGFIPKGKRKECILNDEIVSRRKIVQLAKQNKKDKTSVFVGVSWHKVSSKWRSMICINKKDIHLGVFDCEKEAFCFYKKAEKYEYLYQNSPKLFRTILANVTL
tara:strand:+ start:37 stop:567 length:531 start_codon:yes stop_codon:yes gene_type:complete